jgi:hypothetical protein
MWYSVPAMFISLTLNLGRIGSRYLALLKKTGREKLPHHNGKSPKNQEKKDADG